MDSMSISLGPRFILTSELPLFSVGETLDFMLSSHDLIPNDVSLKVRKDDDDGTYVQSEP